MGPKKESKEHHLHDVVIIGGGISGAALANFLAAQDWDVLILESQSYPYSGSSISWLGPAAIPLLDQMGLKTTEMELTPLKNYAFYSADFARKIIPQLPAQTIHLVNVSQLSLALIEAAKKYPKLLFRSQNTVSKIIPGEESVTIHIQDGSPCFGKLAVLATGTEFNLSSPLQLSPKARGGGAWYACYQCPTPASSSLGTIDYVLGLSGGGFGCRIVKDERTTVEVHVPTSAAQATGDLRQISENLAKQRLIPPDWIEHSSPTSAFWSPAGVCLDMDTHVAKRSLVIGRTGGFISGYTNERLYPSLWSAQLASQTIHQALLSRQPQDKLRDFDSLWRMTMGDHIRVPNADTQSLLPLVFSNQQMANKMLEALQLGTNF